jgi:hypothetical protein
MANKEQNDKELNDYLSGNSDVSKAYRASNKIEPSSHLDNAILSAAKEAINDTKEKSKVVFHKAPWVKPVSIAAMVTLSISLVVTMQQEAGQPLISEPEVEMYDTAVYIKEREQSKARLSRDRVSVMDETRKNEKSNEAEGVSAVASEPTTLGAVSTNRYRIEKKFELPKAKLKDFATKKILKEKRQFKNLAEKSFVEEQKLPSTSSKVEFDDGMDNKQDNRFDSQTQELMNIKKLWEDREFISAKQAFEEFVKKYQNISEESIKEILEPDVYQALIDG